MKKDILKIIAGIVMVLLFIGGIILILADETPGVPIDLSKFIFMKILGFGMFYTGIIFYRNIQWKD